MNTVVLVGRITKKIEIQETQNKNTIAKFTLAVPRDYKNSNGEYDTDFINCVAFNPTSDYLAKYTDKGDLISIKGRIQTGSYTNKDNQKIYTTDVMVERAVILATKEKKKEESKETKEEPKKNIYEEFADETTITDEDLPF